MVLDKVYKLRSKLYEISEDYDMTSYDSYLTHVIAKKLLGKASYIDFNDVLQALSEREADALLHELFNGNGGKLEFITNDGITEVSIKQAERIENNDSIIKKYVNSSDISGYAYLAYNNYANKNKVVSNFLDI